VKLITRKGDTILVRLPADHAELVRELAGQLIELLAERSGEAAEPVDALLAQLGIGGAISPSEDPALARLLPDAYRDDNGAASEHRQLTESSLIERKIANARAVAASLESSPARLDASLAQSWLRTLTDLRLTIAARLEIVTDEDLGRSETASDRTLHDIYEWLGYLQGMLLEVIE
jgi:hypothetical protein